MKLKGIAAAPGIAIAKVFRFEETVFKISSNKINDFKKEIIKLNKTIKMVSKELDKLIATSKKKLGADKAQIFEAHKQILLDPEMFQEIISLIEKEHTSAAYAVEKITNKYHQLFKEMDDEYMKERATDIIDVRRKILANLLGKTLVNLGNIKQNSIIICRDLTPTETANLNEYGKGFVTEIGGATSHSAIMANSLEIPAVVACKGILNKVKTNDDIIIDGSKGEVIIKPSISQIKMYQELIKKNNKEKTKLKKLVKEKTITVDNHQVKLEANIGGVNDVDQAITNGAEAIGLFRSEFLYMNANNWPDEETQFKSYQKVLQKMRRKKVVIRTLDIGGDKTLSYFKFPLEMNPFLGYRALRLSLDKIAMFKTQLRALLRASAFGELKIMFPFIATIEELKKAKKVLQNVEKELTKEKIKIGKYEIGMMMEIPVAAIMSDKFAQHVDFFSIGTNDLLQYSFAADRMNEKVSYLYQPLNPGTLRLIQMIIKNAHQEGIWVGMCGAMAGNELAIPLLLGLKLDDFSMSSTQILKSRNLIKKLSLSKCEDLASKALNCESENQVIKLVQQELKTIL